MQLKQTREKIIFRVNRERKINLTDKLDMVNLVGSRFYLMKLHHLAKYALSKKNTIDLYTNNAIFKYSRI